MVFIALPPCFRSYFKSFLKIYIISTFCWSFFYLQSDTFMIDWLHRHLFLFQTLTMTLKTCRSATSFHTPMASVQRPRISSSWRTRRLSAASRPFLRPQIQPRQSNTMNTIAMNEVSSNAQEQGLLKVVNVTVSWKFVTKFANAVRIARTKHCAIAAKIRKVYVSWDRTANQRSC